MTQVGDAWLSVLLIVCVAAVLGVNAVLLHASNRKANGRFVRPLLRKISSRRCRHRRQQSSTRGILKKAMRESERSGVWEAANRWVKWDPNPSTRAIVKGWIDNSEEDSAKRALMGKRLIFATSGLRGTMGPGFCRINDLVVIQTTQGLCRYLEEQGGEEFKARGVVIGRDHRRQGGLSSEGFAHLAAAVFVSRGFRVFLLKGTVATPLVSFGVTHTKACAGVMVTASHNPKKDNGYKVYWGNGSQIIPPHDAGIAVSIQRNLEPWQVYDPKRAIAGPMCTDPTDDIAEAYFRGIREGLCRRPEANSRTELEVVYSAMHGVGNAWAERAFGCFSLPPFLTVGCQSEPDPEFPTVEYPNPEEQGALKEAMLLAEERGVPLVLANDPDGDRLAVAERQPSGDWHVFSGNDIGVLLGVWQWEEWRRTHPDEDASNAVMIASTVSSKMLSAVAKYEGFIFEETLPGFKWMGHRGQELKAQGKTILFAYEEAIGFGPGDVVFEKDGLSSAALFAEMRVALHNEDLARRAAAKIRPAAAPPPPTTVSSPSPLPCPPPSPSHSSSQTSAGTTQASEGPDAPSRWTNGPVKVPPPSVLLTGGCGKDLAASASALDSRPSSPATVVASPPLSPAFPRESSPHAESALVTAAEAPPDDAVETSITAAAAAAVASEGAAAREQKEERRFSSVLLRRLQALHERYGEFAEENGYVRCEDTEVVSEIFARLRGDGSYRSAFGDYKVTAVRNLAEGFGYDSETADGKPTLPLVPGGAHFLTFKFAEEGVVATLRTSGTEPKIKFYLEMQGEPGVPLDEISARLSAVAEVFVEDALELKRRGMKRVALA